MSVELTEHPVDRLDDYASIPIAFTVRSVFDVELVDRGLGGLRLTERHLDAPYRKDYDAVEPPSRWHERFDVSRWAALVAWEQGQRVGGLIVAAQTPGLHMLEGRDDLAVIWDLRVDPRSRRRGIATRLFTAAEDWAVAHGATALKVETQSINVPACRFYARQGCRLGGLDRFAYPDLPNEVQLLWRKDLSPR